MPQFNGSIVANGGAVVTAAGAKFTLDLNERNVAFVSQWANFPTSEKDDKLAQKLGQLQPSIAVFPQECTGQLASFGPT
jgi:hypothetical protein